MKNAAPPATPSEPAGPSEAAGPSKSAGLEALQSLETIATLAAACRAAKGQISVKCSLHHQGHLTYDDLIAFSREYCRLFDLWVKAKYPSGRNEYGKRIPRPDPRALIR